MWSMRTFVYLQLKMESRAAAQSTYHHARFTERFYRQLAIDHSNDESSEMFLKLAETARKRAEWYQARLRWLRASLPPDEDTWVDHIWRRLLASCTLQMKLKLLDRVRQDDLERIDALLLTRRRWV